MEDEFDFCGRKIATAVLETLEVFDPLGETREGPFVSGAVCAIEELWIRLTGKDLDWEKLKEQLEAAKSAAESQL
jgi:hypothetical protein